jgi:hypothetical protein
MLPKMVANTQGALLSFSCLGPDRQIAKRAGGDLGLSFWQV